MNYIDYEYYINFTKSRISIVEFEELVEIASRIIDTKTMERATKFDSYCDFIKDRIQKATASQVKKLVKDGGSKAIDKTNLVSESIGGYNYTKASKSEQKVETINGIEVSPMVDIYLLPTGLLNRSIRGVN
ncbi:MAG: hypothetical protein J5982_03335 [Bacilli bacterium]|nr:hypothetical protein [Bacilli bacterium]